MNLQMLFIGVFAAAGTANAAKANATADLGFDYLMLARQWPPSFCETTTCSQNTYNLFTIHGLWPNNNDGSSPANCPSNVEFDVDLLPAELRGRMSCVWRSFKGSNAGFWGYEWDKHGTCALPLFPSAPAYFQAGVALDEQYDLNEALVQGGVNPLLAQSVTAAQLQGILERQWKVTPQITCSGGMVQEVRTCFSLALKAIDCPRKSSSCPSTAQDLPFGSTSIPEPCQAWFDGIPPGTNPSAMPPSKTARPPAPAAPPSGAVAALAQPAAVLLTAAVAALLMAQ